mmetsp:Transcript_512/g.1129  ORF Transcript_512/g.1129 Transcript_512/m.1129 type:complete len:85 (+) Transcript_512:806-1060(+)
MKCNVQAGEKTWIEQHAGKSRQSWLQARPKVTFRVAVSVLVDEGILAINDVDLAEVTLDVADVVQRIVVPVERNGEVTVARKIR